MRRLLLSIAKSGKKLLPPGKVRSFYPIKLVKRLLVSRLRFESVEVAGHTMYLDPQDSLLLSINRSYEPFQTEVIREIVKEDYCVLDIGAHIGYYTLTMAKLVGNTGRVYAFEPNPTNFSLLKKNVETNGYKNVVIAQKAVSNKTRRIKLYIREDHSGDHRIYDPGDSRHTVEIETVSLDEYFININKKIDFIKMDIQGAEKEALQGMSNLLASNKNIRIITEFWPVGLTKSGAQPEEYLLSLAQHGFKLYYLNEAEKKIELSNTFELLKICMSRKTLGYVSLLCCREDQAPI